MLILEELYIPLLTNNFLLSLRLVNKRWRSLAGTVIKQAEVKDCMNKQGKSNLELTI